MVIPLLPSETKYFDQFQNKIALFKYVLFFKLRHFLKFTESNVTNKIRLN